MKHIINISRKEKLDYNNLYDKMQNAKISNDYVLINFSNNRFFKIAFNKDQTFTFGYNFFHSQFAIRLGIFLKMYRRSFVNKITQFVLDWLDKLNV